MGRMTPILSLYTVSAARASTSLPLPRGASWRVHAAFLSKKGGDRGISHARHAKLAAEPGPNSAVHPQIPATLRCEPHPHCLACGSEGIELYDGLTDRLAGVPGTWRMARCARGECGMLWLDPQPVAADLLNAYANYHTHGKMARRDAAQFALSALNSTCRILSRLLELGSGLGRQRRQLRTMYIGALTPGTLLEVGCGSGRFLDRMRRRGWQVHGTDFDPAVAARVQRRFGLRVDVGDDLAGFRYAAGSYDVVAMSQVIEHLADPMSQLRECFRVLRPGGRLVLTTPNALAMAHRLYGRNWRGLEPPRHLQVFTPAALERCVGMAGFREARLATLSAESAGVYRASAELAEVTEGLGIGAKAGVVVRSWWMRLLEYRETLRSPHAGQDILLIARKPD